MGVLTMPMHRWSDRARSLAEMSRMPAALPLARAARCCLDGAGGGFGAGDAEQRLVG